MRRLRLLLTILLLCALPALAEQPAVDVTLVGSWTLVLDIYNGYGSFNPVAPTESESYIITVDGQLTSPLPDFPSLPLLYNEATGQWYLQNPEDSAQILTLFTDRYGQLIMYNQTETLVFRHPDAVPAELPPRDLHLATGGTWTLTSLFVPSDEGTGTPACLLDVAVPELPPVTLTLPAFASSSAIEQAFEDAVALQASGTLLEGMNIYGHELLNEDVLLLVTRYGYLLLERTAIPEVDEAMLSHAREMANWWVIDACTIGGIPVSSEAFAGEDLYLAIDEQGNAELNGVVIPLQLEGGTLLLNGAPLRLEGDTLCLEMTDGVLLRFITEADWFRAQLCGTWQLSHVAIPSLELDGSAEDAAMDAQLIIASDDTVVLRHATGELRFTLQRTDDVTEYRLIGADGDVRLLKISSLSLLRISNESGTYVLSFKPIE